MDRIETFDGRDDYDEDRWKTVGLVDAVLLVVLYTVAQRRRLTNLAAMPDSRIDYTDIPRLTGKVNWIRPETLIPVGNKQQITLRLDAEVLEFFKNTGACYQSRINAVLREYVRAHR